MTCHLGLKISRLTSDQSENCSDQRDATLIQRVCTPDPRRLAHGMGKRESQTTILPFGTQPVPGWCYNQARSVFCSNDCLTKPLNRNRSVILTVVSSYTQAPARDAM